MPQPSGIGLRGLLHEVDGLEDRDLVGFDNVAVHDHLVQDEVGLLQIEHDLQHTTRRGE